MVLSYVVEVSFFHDACKKYDKLSARNLLVRDQL